MGCPSPKPDQSASHVLAFVPKDGRDATGVDCARNYRGLVLSSSFHGFVFHPESSKFSLVFTASSQETHGLPFI